jgi:hypothetical protein
MIKEDQVLQKLQSLKNTVKESLRKKGVIVPVKTKRGLKLDDYEIILEESGYVVYDKYQEKIHKNLYFLQTAVLVANSLALRKDVRNEWLTDDRTAGVADFDMKLYETRVTSSVKKKDMFGIQHYQTRLTESKLKYKNYIDSLNNSYFKLLNTLKSIEKSNKYS